VSVPTRPVAEVFMPVVVKSSQCSVAMGKPLPHRVSVWCMC